MKHRVFLIAALFAFVLGGVTASAEDARKIEQFIAKNIDGSNSDFSFICQNSTDSSYYVDEFLTGGNRLNLSTETKIVNLAVAKYPAQVHHLLYKCYFVNYDIFFSAIRTKELQKQKKAIVLSWNIRNLEEEEALSWDYSRKIYLSWNIDSNMDFFHKWSYLKARCRGYEDFQYIKTTIYDTKNHDLIFFENGKELYIVDNLNLLDYNGKKYDIGTHLLETPDGTWCDVFVDDDKLGVGRYIPAFR